MQRGYVWIQRVDFWRYRLSLSISDVNDSMNDSVTVVIHFLSLSIISTHTVITLFYLIIYLLLGMHNTIVSNWNTNFKSPLSILIREITECNKCDHAYDCTLIALQTMAIPPSCGIFVREACCFFLETRKAFADTFVLKKAQTVVHLS